MQTLTRQYTLEEYRQLEETAEERHEYHDGTIKAMTGGTLEHSAIAGNTYAMLKILLKKTRSKPFNSDLRIWVPDYQKGVYPDVLVIEGAPEFSAGRRDEVMNPKLVVEVLSRSTEAYDRGDKFKYYRSLPSLTEYLLINQYRPNVEHYTRADGDTWIFHSYEDIADSVTLGIADATLDLADIYEDITFSTNP